MIRALVKNGLLQPLDPLPKEWSEGQTVEIEGYPEAPIDPESLDQWCRDMDQLTSELNDPEEWKRFDESLAEQRRLSKQYVRRQMGLPE